MAASPRRAISSPPSTEDSDVEVDHGAAGDDPRLALMARAFARMGEILGSAALEALVRHAAQDEGRRIAEGSPPGNLDHAVQAAGQRLGLPMALQGRDSNRAEIRCALGPTLAAPGAHFKQFLTGLLEGLINTNLRVRAQHVADMQVDPGEPLLLAFRW